MENRSRSASPPDTARPPHRPPSPPSSPSPAAPPSPQHRAFDNRAYQPDEPDTNHNSFARSKHNGDSKAPEAVNLELINLTPRNGKAKKEVDVENATNPYDEYFVPVNEHRKYMRGEKLYVTADKRLEKGGCKRPLCWTLFGLVVAAAVCIVVLAASGVLFSNSPTPVDQYNGSVSSARALGGLGHVHDHNHDHNHGHDHNHNHSVDHNHDYNHAENRAAMSDEAVDLSQYVPRTLEGELKIDNEDFISAYEDPESDEYKAFAATLSDALKRAVYDRNSIERDRQDLSVEVISLRSGSVIVLYRIHWKPKNDLGSSDDIFTPETLSSKLNNYLDKNNRMISIYHVAEDAETKTRRVQNVCNINKNECEHDCEFDETMLDFTCTCPPGQFIHNSDPKKCISMLHEETKFPGSSEEKAYSSNAMTPNDGTYSTSTELDLNFVNFFDSDSKSEVSNNKNSTEPVSEPEPTQQEESNSNLEHSIHDSHVIQRKNPEPEPEPTPEPNFDSNIVLKSEKQKTEQGLDIDKSTSKIVSVEHEYTSESNLTQNGSYDEMKDSNLKLTKDDFTQQQEQTIEQDSMPTLKQEPNETPGTSSKTTLIPESEFTKQPIKQMVIEQSVPSPTTEQNLLQLRQINNISEEDIKNVDTDAHEKNKYNILPISKVQNFAVEKQETNSDFAFEKNETHQSVPETRLQDQETPIFFQRSEEKIIQSEKPKIIVSLSEPNIINDSSYERNPELAIYNESKENKPASLFPTLNKMIKSYEGNQSYENNSIFNINKTINLKGPLHSNSVLGNGSEVDKNMGSIANLESSTSSEHIEENINNLFLPKTLTNMSSTTASFYETEGEKSQSTENQTERFNISKYLDQDMNENNFNTPINRIENNEHSNINTIFERTSNKDTAEKLQKNSENSTELTFDEMNSLYNRTSKSFPNKQNNSMESNYALRDDSTDSDWLSETVTEINLKDVTTKLEQSTEFNINKINDVINNGVTKDDFEPDYLNNMAANKQEPMYGMTVDYDTEDSRVKRVNMELSTEDNTTNTLSSAMYTESSNKNTEMITEKNEFSNFSIKTNTTGQIEEKLTSKYETLAPNEINQDTHAYSNNILTLSTSTANNLIRNADNQTSDIDKIEQVINNITGIPNNLNVTIYEISNTNSSLSDTTVKSIISNSNEDDDHETEMNPFLPEIENNKNLVKKLQEGHDIELSNITENQNETNVEQLDVFTQPSDFILDTITNNIEDHNGSITTKSDSFSHKTIIETNNFSRSNNPQFLNEKMMQTNETTEQTKSIEKSLYKEIIPINTFLSDTEDLDNTKELISKEKPEDTDLYGATTIISGTEKDDYLSVVPITQESVEYDKTDLNNDYINFPKINDIVDKSKQNGKSIKSTNSNKL